MSAPKPQPSPYEGFHRFQIASVTFDVPSRYTELEPIGRGAFGQVCSALDTITNERVAIKKVLEPFRTHVHGKRTFRELKLLRSIHHENIINLRDLFTTQSTLENFSDVYIVTDLMGADLNEIIKYNQLTEEQVQFFVYQALRGLKYIHSAGIIHRDLKPSNIAVNENCDLKILDFGLARIYEPEMTGYVATRWYRAPEIMLSWRRYTEAADVWAVGCIMAELLRSGPQCRPLFPGRDHADQLQRIVEILGRPGDDVINKIQSQKTRDFVKRMPHMPGRSWKELFPQASPLAIDLLDRLLTFDPSHRITATEALGHPYLAQYHDENDEPTAPPFDDSFENKEADAEEWKRLTFTEIQSFMHEHANGGVDSMET
eukprot:Clim_evm14s221 gene=Clim_evmTU14s221